MGGSILDMRIARTSKGETLCLLSAACELLIISKNIPARKKRSKRFPPTPKPLLSLDH